MTYSHRDSDWDVVSRQSEPRSYSVRRYVIPSERDSMYRRDEHPMSERELVIRRPHDRDSRYDYEYRRERDYDRESTIPNRIHSHPYGSSEQPPREEHHYHAQTIFINREHKPTIVKDVYRPSSYGTSRDDLDYQIVNRSEADENWALRSARDHREDDFYYTRSTREYDNGRHHRDEYEERYYYGDSPRSSGSRRTRSRHGRDYNSEDETTYSRRERHHHHDESPHHYKRHLAEGALVGVGAAELMRRKSKKDGDESGGLSRIGRDVGAGALGVVTADVIQRARSYHRSKSRRRTESLDRGRDRSRERRHRHRRRRSRSSSDSHVKTLAGLGLGAAAIAGAVALARKKSQKQPGKSKNNPHDRRSRSRHRRGSGSSSNEDRAASHRNKRTAEAGLAGAAVAGLIERARSKSRSRKGEKSPGRIRQGIPIAVAGLGSAAIANLYEKHKEKKESESSERKEKNHRRRSRSRSMARSSTYPDPSRSSPQLIEYGDDPVYGSIPANNYYGRPPSRQSSSPRAIEASHRRSSRRASHSRSRTRSHHYRDDGSGSGSSFSDRGHSHKNRSRSRTRDLATAGLAAAGAGLAAREYTQRQERKRAEKDRRTYAHDHDYSDSYEDGYEPAPYPPSPPSNGPNYYAQGSQFPPPPGAAPVPPPNVQPGPYNPADYPPPPGAAPQPPSNYPYPPPPGVDAYAPRSARGDENVSAVPTLNPALSYGQRHTSSEGLTMTSPGQIPLPSLPPHTHLFEKSNNKPDHYTFTTTPSIPIRRPAAFSVNSPSSASLSTWTSTPRPPSRKKSRTRSSSQPGRAPRTKSVQFDLHPRYGTPPYGSRRARTPTGDLRGYETDDSDSTVDGLDRFRIRRHDRIPDRARQHQQQHPRYRDTTESVEVASDSTIELPDRFDSHGRRLLEYRV
ncbi:conserved hypothetical protein [Histoplasma capsulatum G186AR]|uniref:DUF3824 domain-containing protein n=2 Tax=Ajellomyces capsulatus TaxID=5037 RepID=C0NM90_AJECG|nr:uncharacterized protein HCBG_04620 [Histoplasma capsulatum G186AR]EEH07741.1 conserved hypothetical protein [Histoplasma capsulatum G186AR]